MDTETKKEIKIGARFTLASSTEDNIEKVAIMGLHNGKIFIRESTGVPFYKNIRFTGNGKWVTPDEFDTLTL